MGASEASPPAAERPSLKCATDPYKSSPPKVTVLEDSISQAAGAQSRHAAGVPETAEERGRGKVIAFLPRQQHRTVMAARLGGGRGRRPPPHTPGPSGPLQRQTCLHRGRKLQQERLAGAPALLRPRTPSGRLPLPSPPPRAGLSLAGRKRLYLSPVSAGRVELRGSRQHKIIIHKHEITKSLGTEQQNHFLSEEAHSAPLPQRHGCPARGGNGG